MKSRISNYSPLLLLPTAVCLFFLASPVHAQVPDSAYSASSLKRLSLEELMNIEVTSVSKKPERLNEAPSAIQVITSDDIRQSGVTTLPEALRLAANLQVAKVNASQWAISARGFNNVLADKLLVMIDGRTVYTPLYAGVYWDVQNVMLEDVDRIEVVSGPGGTLWGANAVNGVINIITKSSKATKGLFLQAASGNQLPWMANARFGGNIGDKVSYRIYGMGYKLADTRLVEGDGKANDSWSMAQGGIRVDYQSSSKDQLTVQGDFYDGFPNPDGATAVVVMGGNMLARWSHKVSDKSEWRIQTYYDHTWRDLRNGFTEKLQTLDLDWQYRFPVGKNHEFTWGGDLRRIGDKKHNLELFAFDPEQRNLHIYATFLQDKISVIRDQLDITLGAKVEHNSYTHYEYSPSARVAWTPAGKHLLWAAVSRAVRTPSRIDRDFTLSVAPGVPLIQSSDMVAATLVAYEIGWRTQPTATLSLSVSPFYHVYDKLRSVEPGPPPTGFPLTFGNGVKGHTYGLEIAGNWQAMRWWRLRGGYTFLKKKLKVKEESDDMNNASAESNDAENQILLQSYFDIGKQVEAGIVFRHISKLPQPVVSAYSGLDLRIAWQMSSFLELSVTGQNLLDDRHIEFIPTSPSARAIVRSVYGQLTCRL
ncbi:MAG: TonB-dependent receptor [Chitinophagaceae bacterium]|nr:TonB-dependent receptor [Chitinophagaceae bacterium]